MRSLAPSAELIESYADQLLTSAQRSVNLSLEVLEANEEQARALLKDAQTTADHGPLFTRLKGVPKDHAPIKHVCSLRLEATNGLWARAENEVFLSEEAPDGPGSQSPEGLRLQAKAELRDGTTVELEYELECGTRAEEGKAWEGSRSAGVVLGASLALVDGATKLLGIWRAPEAGEERGKVRMAFLRARTVVLARDINPLVETKLRELVGDLPQDKPHKVVQERKPAPAGMELRVFSVPRSFLRIGYLDPAIGGGMSMAAPASQTESQPADPFAPSPPSGEEGVDLTPRKSAKIPCPEGCSVTFMPRDSTLWVVHDAEGLNRIGAYVDSLWRDIPRTLVFGVEVIETDTAVLQKISDEASDNEGHLRAKETVERLLESQQARVVEHHRLETLSDRNCQVSSLNALTGVFQVGLQATLAASERTMDVEMTLKQGKRTSMNVNSKVRLVAGEPRLVAVWKPVEEGDRDGEKDVLRAAFLKADVVPLERPAKIEPVAKQGAGASEAK